MTGILRLTALAVAAALLLAACGGTSQPVSHARPRSPYSIPPGACEGLPEAKCRAAYVLAGLDPRKCDTTTGSGCLDGPVTPPPATAPASPQISAMCMMGWVNIPAGSGVPVTSKRFRFTAPAPDTADGYSLPDYEAMRVTIGAVQTTSVGTLTIVWYGPSGGEISSGTADIGQVITAGQHLTFLFDESMGSSPNPPQGAATCQVTGWTS